MKAPVLGKPIERMMVKEHEPFPAELLAPACRRLPVMSSRDGSRMDAQMTRSAIDRLLLECRRDLERVPADRLAEEMERGALVVDTRPVFQRERDGELPGAVVVDRNVLEWRLDPTSPSRLAEVDTRDRRVIVVCDEGYSSTLAAHTLRRLGLDATDLEGGFQAWRACSSAGS